MKMRSHQTRAFDIESTDQVVRGVVSALQDLGFIIERANAPMGLVTAGKFKQGSFVEVTVVVRRKGTNQNEVRVNALFNTQPIEDPKVYQNFFIAVEKSLFISS
jgi:succinyl-CoA synthetase beta subunit